MYKIILINNLIYIHNNNNNKYRRVIKLMINRKLKYYKIPYLENKWIKKQLINILNLYYNHLIHKFNKIIS